MLFIDHDLPPPPQVNAFQEAAPHPVSAMHISTSQKHMLAFGYVKSTCYLNHSSLQNNV